MSSVIAVLTLDYRKYLAQHHVPELIDWDPTPVLFKVGEGGWIDRGAGRVQRDPVGTLRREEAPLIQDIDAIVDTTRSAGDQRYPEDSQSSFEKELEASDVTFEGDTTLSVRIFLDLGEYNDDGNGDPPEIWEVGIYAEHPTEVGEFLLIAYGTMPDAFIKDGVTQFLRYVKIAY